jgi:protein SDA1
LTSHQKDVTLILAYLIQACHDLTPPEDLMPVVKTIAYNFITERCTNEVVAVGINSTREIILRAPSLLLEPGMEELIQDLSMYSKKMHKSVTVAARGFINTVR